MLVRINKSFGLKFSLISIFALFSIQLLSQTDYLVSLPTTPRAIYSFDDDNKIQIKELFFVLKSDTSLRHGQYKAYTVSNILIKEGTYNKGQKNGYWKYWYIEPPNNLKTEGRFANGEQIDNWKYYTKGGGLKEETFYDGKGKANSKKYNDNGKLQAKGNLQLRAGRFFEVGTWTYWHKNGQKESEGNFFYNDNERQSRKMGNWTYWYPSGIIEKEEQYNNLGILDGKNNYYDNNGHITKSETYLSGNLQSMDDIYTFQCKKIEEILNENHKYKVNFPAIYNLEINELIKEFESYKNSEKNELTFKKGEEIIKKSNNLNQSYNQVVQISNDINTTYQRVKELFNPSFTKIYEIEILGLQSTINKYSEIGTVTERIKTGDSLLIILITLEKNHNFLTEQENAINEKFALIELIYKGSFPILYNSEIIEFQEKIKNYKNLGISEERLVEGKIILDFCTKFQDKSVKIKKIDDEVNAHRSSIEQFKEEYRPIYDNITPLIMKEFSNYQNSISIEEKFKLGEILIRHIQTYEKHYQDLENQYHNLKIKFQEFDLLYKNDKDNMILYSRGKKLYEFYIEDYRKQAATVSRLSTGDNINQILKAMIDLKGKDNKILNQKLIEAVTPIDMINVFGFKAF